MGPCAMTYAMVSRESSPVLRAEALNAFTDCYDISWIPINGVTDYTVRVFTGENCGQLYRSVDVTGAQAFVYNKEKKEASFYIVQDYSLKQREEDKKKAD